MNQPTIIVYERHSRWAPLLRRDLGEQAACVQESRSSEQTRSILRQPGSALLVIEPDSKALEKQLELLKWLSLRATATCTVSVGPAIYAKLMAEAGAVAHFTSLQQIDQLARLARRYLRQPRPSPPDASQPELHCQWQAQLKWPLPPADTHST
jgi:transposase